MSTSSDRALFGWRMEIQFGFSMERGFVAERWLTVFFSSYDENAVGTVVWRFVVIRLARLHFCVYGLFSWGSTAVIVTATE